MCMNLCVEAGYWNIKECGHAARDLIGKSSAVSSLRCGGFRAIAPQMRHTKKREDEA
jgi:hypothetical protein